MSDENEQSDSNSSNYDGTAPPSSNAPVVMAIISIVLLASAAIYFAQKQMPESGPCAVNNATVKAQAEAQKAIQDYGASINRRDIELRLEVIKQCVAKGYIPIMINGNVDCKVAPK